MRYFSKTPLIIFACFLLISVSGFSKTTNEIRLEKRVTELETQLDELKTKQEKEIEFLKSQLKELINNAKSEKEENELATLRKSALEEAKQPVTETNKDDGKTFVARNLGLQAENPELSVTGDILATFQNKKGVRKHADATFRTLGVHLETYLDPYTRFKSAFPILENGTTIGEAYITRYGFAKNLNLTLGKFRQQFGVVNRWHKHGLDQVDFPLPLRRIFGDGGLNQLGASFDWNLGSKGNSVQELQFQLTEASNGMVFGQNAKGVPSGLIHYKNYRDLDENTYQEFGLTAMAGANDQWNINRAGVVTVEDKTRPTYVFGLDFTRFWEPSDNMRYRNFLWRTELYGMVKNILAPDGSGNSTLKAWGGYTNFQWKLNRVLETGLRFDYFQPDTNDYAATPGQSLFPYAVANGSAHEYQIAPYITWHQSPWVRYRLEFNYKSGKRMGEDDKRLMLQCIWAAGPHKHERY